MLVSAPAALSRSRGLGATDFEQIARNGFGDRYNAYAHSMAWFQDHLYVGTSRNNFVMIKVTVDDGVRKAKLPVWPVEKPDELQDVLSTLASEIWRFNPKTREWTRVHVASMVRAASGYDVPDSVSFRTMIVFQGRSDEAPALYVPTRPTSHTGATVMLRSTDGLHFEAVSEPGLGLPEMPKGIRGFQIYKGRLFCAPAESGVRGQGNVAAVMQILESSDPARGDWKVCCEPGFGELTNKTAFDLAVFNGYLYAGTVNIEEGFQVWKTDAEGEPPYRWTKVLTGGAFRGPLNQIAQTLCPFREHLYVGSAIQGFRDHENNIGPAPVEVVRLAKDDSWELVCGEPRLTPDGLKIPISGRGPGFGCQSAGYLWMMCEHDGWLYAADAVWTILLRYSDRDTWPPILKENLSEDMLEWVVQNFSGFDLWRTRDGVRWTSVTRNGFGNHYNIGCRTMVSTEYGLFVGGINPFGPKVAVKRVGGWRYEQNHESGLEIWLGNPREELDTADVTSVSRSVHGPDQSSTDELLESYYGGSEFRLCGYWVGATRAPRQACENLMEEALSLFGGDYSGDVLDVGCGRGASTRYLLKYFDAARVVGVTGEKSLLPRCRVNAPGAAMHAMKLPRLRFPAEAFDKIVCMEASGQSGFAPKLWSEIYRVLQPGGRVVATELLVLDEEGKSRTLESARSTTELEARLQRMNFKEIRVFDLSEQCWTGFLLHRAQHLTAKLRALGASDNQLRDVLARLPGADRVVEGYVMFSAVKG